MNGHHIRITIDTNTATDAAFICHEPDGAPCHLLCQHPECEEGCRCLADGREPQPQDEHECLPCTWLNNETIGWEELYEGPETEVRCGPIDIRWDSDDYTYLWSYAEQVTA